MSLEQPKQYPGVSSEQARDLEWYLHQWSLDQFREMSSEDRIADMSHLSALMNDLIDPNGGDKELEKTLTELHKIYRMRINEMTAEEVDKFEGN